MKSQNAISPEEAKSLIRKGKAPDGLKVEGSLDLTELEGAFQLPEGLSCDELNLSGTQISELPSKLDVKFGITLDGCEELVQLPKKLTTGTLSLQSCRSLTSLPEGLDVWFLNASGCSSLTRFPKKASLGCGEVHLSGCTGLRALPPYIDALSKLDISDCPGICELPENLQVNLWIDVGGSGLSSLPDSLRQTGLRWRSVPVDYRIAFHPETIKAEDALKERNAEKRRVLIERMSHERFMQEAGARELDSDTDPGGDRKLLHVPLENDEDMVCLSCFCPSTQRHYFLRVPPETKTCHQAAAWMAGFDDPSKYKPIIET